MDQFAETSISLGLGIIEGVTITAIVAVAALAVKYSGQIGRMISRPVGGAWENWQKARKVRQLRKDAARKAYRQPVEIIPWPPTFVEPPIENATWEARWQHHVRESDRTIESGFRCLAEDLAVALCGLAIKVDRVEVRAKAGWRVIAWRDGMKSTVCVTTELPITANVEKFEFVGFDKIPETVWKPLRDWLIDENRTEDELTEACRMVWAYLPMNSEIPVGRWNNNPAMQSTIMKWNTHGDTVFYAVIHANNDVAHCWRGTTNGIPNEANDYLFVKLMRNIWHAPDDRRRRIRPLTKGLSHEDGSPCSEERTGRMDIQE